LQKKDPERPKCAVPNSRFSSSDWHVIITAMPESQESQTLLILVCACAGLLVILIFMLLRIGSRLSNIEGRLASRKTPETPEAAPSVAETSPGGAFESFLEEDPGRREMPKKEQFAAYRQWRQERGLNWSASQEKPPY